jgi:hypothetical protein
MPFKDVFVMEPIKKTIGQDPYSTYIGHAAEDLAEDSTFLKVICAELMPGVTDGPLAAGITQGTSKLTDRDGGAITTQFTSANHLVASWEGATNRRVPPMVRKGEPVEIFRANNQDKFYWREAKGFGREFRTSDRIHLEVAAGDPTKPGTTKDDTNTYVAYIDAVAKKIGVKTSQANKEAMAFTMEADLGAGTFYASDKPTDPDKIGNRIFLDTGAVSGTPKFQVNLSVGTTLTLDGENMLISVPKGLLIKAGDRIVFDSPITVLNLSNKGTIFLNAANLAVNAGKDFIVTAGNVIGLNARSTKIGGVLVATAARISAIVHGVFGSNYSPSTIQRPQDTSVKDASNSADTTMTGAPYT